MGKPLGSNSQVNHWNPKGMLLSCALRCEELFDFAAGRTLTAPRSSGSHHLVWIDLPREPRPPGLWNSLLLRRVAGLK